ncbi:MAG TPA: ATPase, T2SS/T4P/T4SS family [Phycisphaerae bacterium]|nr:ATPase, T2SS/T4P/T4SS family [Phycisphaerae bacterium]HOM51307.1 ATPase, T2SS/T4P/T4SS family [Phycisphaerae bacterium]HPP26729.1 ATPase, T2SS/T4P/T4SS family [Phycisphaerae bacterium]HPU27808.1 ATPase, T2SS/T4P/T4SS family [Phycisphaerae bacterium]HQE28526.1 ATPase, T2SS/T4P/T4SS family [Phycisphaerae bacterium]
MQTLIQGQEKLGTILVKAGVITEQDLETALRLQRQDKGRLGETLIEMGVLSPQVLVDVLASRLGVKGCVLRHGLVDPAVTGIIDREEAKRLRVLPLFKVNNRLTVAMVEPQHLPAVDRLASLTGCEINPVLVMEQNYIEFAERYLSDEVSVDTFLLSLDKQEVEFIDKETPDDDTLTDLTRTDSSPVVNLVNLSLLTAIRDRASDVHVEPDHKHLRVRYRIDGVLRELLTAPRAMHAGVISRIKVLAKMDIAEKRLPQEGRVRIVVEGRDVDLRVSTMPTILGEKAVIRILDRANLNLDMAKLGFQEDSLAAFKRMLFRPHGLVLVTGPTGSGKTTTLYSALDLLRSVTVNILTVEDPVEYQLDLINQIHVQEHIGLTFARALRSILRQDPDVIMVGEIRDADTASVAVQAALTGHLVLSTLHTKSCIGTLARLTDMGVEPYLLASALNGVVAQRLARTICPDCRTTYIPDRQLLQAAGWSDHAPRIFYRGAGCKKCHDSGFKGRMGIYEVLEMDEMLYSLIYHGADEEAIREHLVKSQNFRSLRDEGLMLVEAGKSTLEEVLRVTHLETEETVRAEKKELARV